MCGMAGSVWGMTGKCVGDDWQCVCGMTGNVCAG